MTPFMQFRQRYAKKLTNLTHRDYSDDNSSVIHHFAQNRDQIDSSHQTYRWNYHCHKPDLCLSHSSLFRCLTAFNRRPHTRNRPKPTPFSPFSTKPPCLSPLSGQQSKSAHTLFMEWVFSFKN